MRVEPFETAAIDGIAVHVGSGATPRGGSEVYTSEGALFIRSQNVRFSGLELDDVAFIDDRTHRAMARSEVFPADVLLNITGASIGRCCVLPAGVGPANVNQHVCAIRLPGADPRDASFLSAVLGSHIGQSQVAQLNAGGNREGLNFQQIRAFVVPWPGAGTRRRIAEILDTIDEAIRKTEQVIAKLQQMKQGLLHDLLTRGIDENGELRDPERHPEQFQDSPLGRIPKAWGVRCVREAGTVQLGRQRSPEHAAGPHMRPYLRVANVFDGFIDFSDVLEMNFTPAEQATFSLEPGDILLNEGQSLELVGRCAVYNGEPGAFCFQNTLIRFRPNPGQTDHRFARTVFKRCLDTRRFVQIAKQTTSVAHLGSDRFAKLPFPLPPLDEQQRIAVLVAQVEARQEADRLGLGKLRDLKNGLMDDLLTGRVRVPAPEEAAK